MKLKWLGTAGFQIDTGRHVFLVDPYLSRHPESRPLQVMQACDICEAEQVFVSHGHFDHIADIPEIVKHNPCSIYCSKTAANTLKRKGIDSGRINSVLEDGYTIDFHDYNAQAFYSRHIIFDIPLVARTLWNIGSSWPHLLKMHLAYPEGQVLSWKFTIGGYTIHHFGTAGSTRKELERLAVYQPDLLLIPLQGHTRINDIALEYIRMFRPRMVIAHHHDDFYPPISSSIDIEHFVRKVKEQCCETEMKVLEINQTIEL